MKTKITPQLLVDIAQKAGDAILTIYHTTNIEEWEIETKSDNTPLSKADRLAAEYINNALLEVEPDLLIINEEGPTPPFDTRKEKNRYCLVDPLDGTKEFIKRNGEFTVNIALFEKNKPVISVVHAPVFKETYYGVQGEGAFHFQKNKKLHVSQYNPNEKNLTIVASRSHLSEETKQFISEYRTPNLVSMGSSLKFMLIASGTAHLYPRLAPTMEWDTAAAQLIVEEAGGSVVDYHHKTPLVYNKSCLKNPWFIVEGKISP